MILREALERLNQNPTNSSKPSSSLAPWDKSSSDDDDATSIFDEQEALNSEIDQERSSDVTTDQTTEDTNNDCCLTNNEVERALRHCGSSCGESPREHALSKAVVHWHYLLVCLRPVDYETAHLFCISGM